MNENKNITFQNLWNTAKTVLRGNLQQYRYQEIRKISNSLTFYLKNLEKEQTKPEVSKMKEIINIRAEINKIVTKKVIEKINETKGLFFGMIKKFTNLQPNSSRKKRERSPSK